MKDSIKNITISEINAYQEVIRRILVIATSKADASQKLTNIFEAMKWPAEVAGKTFKKYQHLMRLNRVHGERLDPVKPSEVYCLLSYIFRYDVPMKVANKVFKLLETDVSVVKLNSTNIGVFFGKETLLIVRVCHDSEEGGAALC